MSDKSYSFKGSPNAGLVLSILAVISALVFVMWALAANCASNIGYISSAIALWTVFQ